MTTLTMPMGLVNLDMLANLHSDEPLVGRQMVWYWRTVVWAWRILAGGPTFSYPVRLYLRTGKAILTRK